MHEYRRTVFQEKQALLSITLCYTLETYKYYKLETYQTKQKFQYKQWFDGFDLKSTV